MKKITLLLILLVTACTQKGATVSIFNNSKCDLPCWNDITPGKTSQGEALQILKDLDGVEQKSIVGPNQPREIFSGIIFFSLYLDPRHKDILTNGEVYILNNKVIALNLKQNLGLTFEGMETRLGQPENIVSIPFNGRNPVVMAINSEEGVKYEFFAKWDGELSAETKIDAVLIFDPAYYEDLLETGMFSTGAYGAADTKRIMYPWKGYGSIEELYPPRFP